MLTGKQETDGLAFLDAYTSGVDRQNSYPLRDVIATPRGQSEAREVSYQEALDEVQRGILKDERSGKLPILLEHTHMLMSSATLNAHIPTPRVTRPTPIIVDKCLDLDGHEDCHRSRSSPSYLLTHPNPTLLSDRFFFGFTPIITIRHPALMVPSLIRGRQKLQGIPKLDSEFAPIATYRWEKLVFDSYRSYYAATTDSLSRKRVPIVIDGSKLAQDPYGTMERMCEVLGMSEEEMGVRYMWEPNMGPARDKFWEVFTGELRRSSGVKPSGHLPETLDLEKEKSKWVNEWGPDVADKIEAAVNDAMEDYEYLSRYSL
ncbi:hypothetical protein E1B28_013030 [Marasmius oreades]|uniref:Sulfotransferase n=1 Tax=Marasmius oreades TaxID=181124 RepID=A0A9P7RPU0_9AGAR|nr:uncharacterized protein E1B28_013030 [Marasmius oreades]KAG7087051.1 hypothetical protein E1B28_013030 [Marasmius oreades]